MGFISNQWLNRGQKLRNRTYSPKPVSVECLQPSDTWSKSNEVFAEFNARKNDGLYQTLHLSQQEVDAAGPQLFGCMSGTARETLIAEWMRTLSNAKLLRILALDLRDRVRLPK